MTNRAKFVESYARRLRTHWTANRYEEPMPESFEERAERAIEAFLSFDSEPGIILRMTLREFGLDQTYDSLRDFLTTV